MTTLAMPTYTGFDAATHFERLYCDAHGDRTRLPWSDGVPNPALVTWLNVIAPSVVRCGSRTAVVGCGLGDDAQELIRRGYDVTAFDASGTAIEWARRLHSSDAECYHRADLFDLPPRWRHRFDLVVEIYTLQSFPPEQRAEAMSAIAELLGPHGHLLVICRGEDDALPADPPPWPLTVRELTDLADAANLEVSGRIDSFMDGETPPKQRHRALLRRRRH